MTESKDHRVFKPGDLTWVTPEELNRLSPETKECRIYHGHQCPCECTDGCEYVRQGNVARRRKIARRLREIDETNDSIKRATQRLSQLIIEAEREFDEDNDSWRGT